MWSNWGALVQAGSGLVADKFGIKVNHLRAKGGKATLNALVARDANVAWGGGVLAIEIRTGGKYGNEQLHVTVKTTQGTKGFYCPSLLTRDLKDRDVKVGDTLAVRYVSDVPSGKGAPAKCFRVFHVKGKGKGK